MSGRNGMPKVGEIWREKRYGRLVRLTRVLPSGEQGAAKVSYIAVDRESDTAPGEVTHTRTFLEEFYAPARRATDGVRRHG